MFKRLFFISGAIALVLTCLAMWFWYLPSQEASSPQPAEMPVDSIMVSQDSIAK